MKHLFKRTVALALSLVLVLLCTAGCSRIPKDTETRRYSGEISVRFRIVSAATRFKDSVHRLHGEKGISLYEVINVSVDDLEIDGLSSGKVTAVSRLEAEPGASWQCFVNGVRVETLYQECMIADGDEVVLCYGKSDLCEAILYDIAEDGTVTLQTYVNTFRGDWENVDLSAKKPLAGVTLSIETMQQTYDYTSDENGKLKIDLSLFEPDDYAVTFARSAELDGGGAVSTIVPEARKFMLRIPEEGAPSFVDKTNE